MCSRPCTVYLNSTHMYVLKTLYSTVYLNFCTSTYQNFRCCFLCFLLQYFLNISIPYYVTCFCVWFGWMYCDCRYTPGKCGSFTDQSLCRNARPGVKCMWNRRRSKCQPISGLPPLFMMTVHESQDTQSAEEKILKYEKCHYQACHLFILPLLLHPYGIWVLN